MSPSNNKCEWKLEEEGYHSTSCGRAWELSTNHTLSEHGMAFCPFCGHRINESGHDHGITTGIDLHKALGSDQAKSMGIPCNDKPYHPPEQDKTPMSMSQLADDINRILSELETAHRIGKILPWHSALCRQITWVLREYVMKLRESDSTKDETLPPCHKTSKIDA